MELFSHSRSSEQELLDSNQLSLDEYRQTLKQLERLNRWTRSYQVVTRALEKYARMYMRSRIRVLDVGFGYGDTLRALSRWSETAGVELELIGIDLNPWAKVIAEQVTPRRMKITYLTGNVFDEEGPSMGDYDVIISSLMTHHLTDEEVVKLIKWMSSDARRLWVISDLHRHQIPFLFIKFFVCLFGFNHVIQNDAPLSVARSFTRRDWCRFIQFAEIPSDSVEIEWYWPFRYCVACDTIKLRNRHVDT